MKRSMLALPVLGLLGLGGCIMAEPMRETTAYGFSQDDALREVNALRTANRLPPLAREARLAAAAEAQSAAMASRDRMGHDVDGPLPARVTRFGYQFSAAAENIAYGQKTFESAMKGWEASPGHRRNLLDPMMTEAGFAAVMQKETGRIYWTQIFARPRQTVPQAGPTALTFAGVPIPSR